MHIGFVNKFCFYFWVPNSNNFVVDQTLFFCILLYSCFFYWYWQFVYIVGLCVTPVMQRRVKNGMLLFITWTAHSIWEVVSPFCRRKFIDRKRQGYVNHFYECFQSFVGLYWKSCLQLHYSSESVTWVSVSFWYCIGNIFFRRS